MSITKVKPNWWWIATMDDGVIGGPFPTKAAALSELHFHEYPTGQRRQSRVRTGFWNVSVTDGFIESRSAWWVCTSEVGVAEGIPRSSFDNRYHQVA